VLLRGAAAEGGRVAIEVADRGRGISATDLPRIFEPFYTTRGDGTGLGLAIVQKIVRAHSGDVVVRSTPGQGSSFTVLLPAGA
jgi:signal transduction histidine kinase